MLIKLYTVLLRLYPRQFRQEFAAEMQTVFGEALGWARRAGLWAMLQRFSREARQLPRALVCEYWQSFREKEAGLVNTVGRMVHMMVTNEPRPGWIFYQGWVIFSAFSIPIALGIAMPLVSLVKIAVGDTLQVGGITHITEDFLIAPIFLLVLGLLTGLWQHLLLHPYLPRKCWWTAVTVLGMVLGLVGGMLLFRVFPNPPEAIWFRSLATMFYGGFIGLVQWLMLRKRVRHAGWWILANVLGWGVFGWGAMILPDQIIPRVGMLLLPGLITSLAMWLLLDGLPRHDGRVKDLTPNKTLDPTP